MRQICLLADQHSSMQLADFLLLGLGGIFAYTLCAGYIHDERWVFMPGFSDQGGVQAYAWMDSRGFCVRGSKHACMCNRA